MIRYTLWLILHNSLHITLHYSISQKKGLDMIIAFCNFSGIDFIMYNTDTSYADFDDVK